MKENGKIIKKNGKGEYYWNNDDYYKGEWKNDKLYGNGTLLYYNNDIYEGYFKENLRDGKGIFYSKLGIKFEGNWEKNNVKEGYVEFKNGNKIYFKNVNNKISKNLLLFSTILTKEFEFFLINFNYYFILKFNKYNSSY